MKKDIEQTPEATPAPELALSPEVEQGVNAALDFSAKVNNAVSQNFALAQGIGMVQAFDFMAQFTGIARLKWLKDRKESGDYKGLSVPLNGGLKELKTFDDLCDFAGISISKAKEDLQNLAVFGEAFLQSAETLGLGYRQLRQLRALPEDTRQMIIDGEAVAANDPEALKDLIEDLAGRNAKEKEEKENLKADLEARDKVLADKNKKLDEVQTKIEKLQNLTPNEKIKNAVDRDNNALEAVNKAALEAIGGVAVAIAQVTAVLERDDVAQSTKDRAFWYLQSLCDSTAEMLLENGINIDLANTLQPEWTRELAKQDYENNQ